MLLVFELLLLLSIIEGHTILIDIKKLKRLSSRKKSIIDFSFVLKFKYCLIPKIFSFENENELSIVGSIIMFFFDNILI